MNHNIWTDYPLQLADAYIRSASPLRFELITEELKPFLPDRPARILDIGGGFGEQAICLARLGHHVDIVDIDPNMLSVAYGKIIREHSDIGSRIALLEGDCLELESIVTGRYDLICCHSVLAYLERIDPLLEAIAKLCTPGGYISTLSVNPQCLAMRAGLQQKWQEAIDLLQGRTPQETSVIQDFPHSLDSISGSLEAYGMKTEQWSGLGVFTDHLIEPVEIDMFDQILEVERVAGKTDPYRSVARCFHLISRKMAG